MDDNSLWTFMEVEDLKHKIQYMTYELEITRKEASEEMRKNNEHIKKLIQLVKTATKERDEARAELQKLQEVQSYNKKPIFDQFIPVTDPFSPDSPLLTSYPGRTNSGLTESNNSLSIETHYNNSNNNNTQNIVSSPVVDSISSDSCNIGFSGNTFKTPTVTTTAPSIMTPPTKVVDQGTLIIQNMAKGRPLPQKGRLLQAVIEAGPLLQTLLVAGSLPRWRNPPGSLTRQIPPVNIKGCGSSAGVSTSTSTMVHKNVPDYGQFSSGTLGVCPSPMLDFGSGSSGSCFMGGRLMPSAVNFDCQIPKRQRLM